MTETWTDRRGQVMKALGRLVTGVQDGANFSATSIEHTLGEVKALAEREVDREPGPAA